MKKLIFESIIEFVKSNKFQAFLRTTFNGLVSLVIVHLSGLDYTYIPLFVACLNLITKELNRNFNPNFDKKGKN